MISRPEFNKLEAGDRIQFDKNWVDPAPDSYGTIIKVERNRMGQIKRLDVQPDDGGEIVVLGGGDNAAINKA